MSDMRQFTAAGLGLMLLAVAAGCSKSLYDVSDTKTARGEREAPAPSKPAPPVAPLQERPMPTLSGAIHTESVSNAGEQRLTDDTITTSAHHVVVEPAAESLRDVYFPYDSWRITEDGRQALSLDLTELKAALPGKTLLIEGHCDERGTEAYNLVLGERRAQAVAQYLIDLGLPAAGLGTVSYGEKRPFCQQHGEPCWQQNRRAHLVVRTS
jgi:peptidoglycan-associated lipoprotein